MVITLLMIVVVASLAAVSARFALSGERSGRGDRDREVAFQAAEAALGDAVRDIVGPIPPASTTSTRFASFCPSATNAGLGFPTAGEAPCNTVGDDLGKCMPKQPDALPAWMSVNWDRDGVPIGRFTGNVNYYPTGTTSWMPHKAPRYIIEPILEGKKDELDSITETSIAASQREQIKWLYQITAIGYGANPETRVVLQQIIRKEPNNCSINNSLSGQSQT
jgi:type IV pilus assembly protein PilX